MHSSLGREVRSAALAAMASEQLDVLVIGGGIVGAGVALDAATRGLSVGVVESQDWASGTSSRSSKLIHGGLRYLEMLDFRLVAEALRERSLLLGRLAPHLVEPVPFLYPLTHRFWERPYVAMGIGLYDAMAAARGREGRVPRHLHLSRSEALRLFPALSPDGVVGAIQYWDGLVDDARYTMMVIRTATMHGALCANRARVLELRREGERVTGARIADGESGQVFDVRARQVINATGVWTDEIQSLGGATGRFSVRPSKGVHLLVPRDRIKSGSGLILRTETSVLFVIPWGHHWIIGTTDTDWPLDKDHPAASARDLEYLLDHVNRVLATPLTDGDVVGVYAGLRPLVSGNSGQTSRLSREHLVVRPAPGLVTVAGGKYTTYRIMARDAVDAAIEAMGGSFPECSTDKVSIVGAEGSLGFWNRRHWLAESSGLGINQVEHLLRRYGALTEDVLSLVREDSDLGRPLPGDAGHYIGAEIVYAATCEGALHLEDALGRRTRIAIECLDGGKEAAPVVAELMGRVLGWSADRQALEVEYYARRVNAERAAREQPDDCRAEAALMQAPGDFPLQAM